MDHEAITQEPPHNVTTVSGMYKNWFLDYASYVILERAVPAIEDGLKPVQRRILHAMKEMEDGRYNKISNIIGSTMQYHPHGDASISDAIVNLGQKRLLIDTQGNWGDVRTGDPAAAARYIEARISKFALEVIFNSQITDWQLAYDGRKKEPVVFPVKFPLLLAQGVEGIAVGLATKILPHNFCEILKAAIAKLKGKSIPLYPDFPTGGNIDVSEYNNGKKGGRVRVRSTIKEVDNKTIVITNIPYGTSTTSLIESIVRANEKGKIKIKQVVDNTAKDIEIVISLFPGTSPDITTDALYAFTDCEIVISPNACVIMDEKPQFLSITEILEYSINHTVALLQRELEIKKLELLEKMLFGSLEKIFIEHRIYRDIEVCETWGSVLATIDNRLNPFKKQFYRKIIEEDIVRLTEIKIKRISKFDAFKADEMMKKCSDELKDTQHHLKNLTEYALAHYQSLLDKYGKNRARNTEITNFDIIKATEVAAHNAKLYINKKEGFIGSSLKQNEFVCECSDLDDIIIFTKDGKCIITRLQEKMFVGKDILYAQVFKRNDERMIYNLCYLDGSSGKTYVKRFQMLSVTRDRPYHLIKGNEKSKILYFTANTNGEAEIIGVYLSQSCSARKKILEFDFSSQEIKGRNAGGNILTKYPIRKIVLKEVGKSTLGGTDIWYDTSIGKLNKDRIGVFLGNFVSEDHIIAFYKNGSYEITHFELINRYDTRQLLKIYKFDRKSTFNIIYLDGNSHNYYVKRFLIETHIINRHFSVVSEKKGSKLLYVSQDDATSVTITHQVGKKHEQKQFDIKSLIDIKGWKAVGNKLQIQKVVKVAPINLLASDDTKDNHPNQDEHLETNESQLSLFLE